MSATNRGSSRIANDAYYTPPELANRLVGLLPIQPYEAALEPHVGGGAFAEALLQATPNITACDIEYEAAHTIRRRLGITTLATDFLNYHLGGHNGFDWIVGNPPYQGAMDHILHAFELLKNGGNLCFLLRLAFLESKKRAPFWVDHPAHKIWVLAERPSFTGGGTDNCAYGFFWWKKRGEFEPRPASTLEVLSWR